MRLLLFNGGIPLFGNHQRRKSLFLNSPHRSPKKNCSLSDTAFAECVPALFFFLFFFFYRKLLPPAVQNENSVFGQGVLTCTSPGSRHPPGPQPGFPYFELSEGSPMVGTYVTCRGKVPSMHVSREVWTSDVATQDNEPNTLPNELFRPLSQSTVPFTSFWPLWPLGSTACSDPV